MDTSALSHAKIRGLAAQSVKSNLRRILSEAKDDHVYHAQIVAGGQFTWRQMFQREMGVFYNGNRNQVDDLANSSFNFLKELWAKMHPEWPNPGKFLDSINIPTPPSPAEIDEAWELEIAGSESAMRTFYEGSARYRKGSDLGVRAR